MNTKLLRKIQKQILKEPEQFDMGDWFSNRLKWKIPNCGTAACIGGWAISLAAKLSPRDYYNSNLGLSPQSVLGLSPESSNRLFCTSMWPPRFRHAYNQLTNPSAKARIAVARIDHFIKTKGLE